MEGFMRMGATIVDAFVGYRKITCGHADQMDLAVRNESARQYSADLDHGTVTYVVYLFGSGVGDAIKKLGKEDCKIGYDLYRWHFLNIALARSFFSRVRQMEKIDAWLIVRVLEQ